MAALVEYIGPYQELASGKGFTHFEASRFRSRLVKALDLHVLLVHASALEFGHRCCRL